MRFTVKSKPDEELKFEPVGRPQYQLRSLPIRYRWEATRRNPTYQACWDVAIALNSEKNADHPAQSPARELIKVLLGGIGYSGPMANPGMTFDELSRRGIHDAWLTGAIHPLTFRGLAGLLILGLSKEELNDMAGLCAEASSAYEDPLCKLTALTNLDRLSAPGWNNYADEPIVCINPTASSRQVHQGMNALLKEWKEERNLQEKRDRSDKYAEYFQVWDLREGWTESNYDRGNEKNFKQVAAHLERGVATIASQYQSAFELVVGHSYTVELWLRTMGPLKLSGLWEGSPGQVSKRRPLQSRTRRPVPEAALQVPLAHAGAQSLPDSDVSILLGDIQELLAKGLNDQQIVKELDLSAPAVDAVAYLRERFDNDNRSKNSALSAADSSTGEPKRRHATDAKPGRPTRKARKPK